MNCVVETTPLAQTQTGWLYLTRIACDSPAKGQTMPEELNLRHMYRRPAIALGDLLERAGSPTQRPWETTGEKDMGLVHDKSETPMIHSGEMYQLRREERNKVREAPMCEGRLKPWESRLGSAGS